MNNPNPFIPQGSLLEQKNKKRARVRLAVYIIFAANILVISPLLIQGCKKEAPIAENPPPPVVDTNPPPPDTNAPALPPMSNSTPVAVVDTNPPPPPPPPPAPTTQEYVVAKGDSFYTIAKKFNLKIKEVEAANPSVVPTKLKVGEKLTIPAAGTSGGATGEAPAPGATATSGEEYTVKSGDTLTKIAKEHGVTVKALRAVNDLKTDKIKVGEKLKLPEKSAAATETAAPAPAMPAPPVTTPAPAPTPAPPMNNPAPGGH
jgi:LysM repeat protein